MTTSVMNDSKLHIVAPVAQHTHTIIFLHGRGSDAREFESEFFEGQASDDRFLSQIFPGLKWVFPCAAVRYADTEKEEMHQWFDMASVREPSKEQEKQIQGLQESVSFVLDTIKKEAAEIGGMENIFLGGISQGCATAIIALLIGGIRIAGFVGLNSWLPFQNEFQRFSPETPTASVRYIRKLLYSNHPCPSFGEPQTVWQTPILLEHAKDDDVIPLENGFRLREGLKTIGMHVDCRFYEDGGHWVNEPHGIDDIVYFLTAQMT
jgi:lysophospholipase-2